MIGILKKIWKVEGMDFKDNPADSQGVFRLVYGKQLIGVLTYSNGVWSFEYSSEFKRNSFAQPIMDFPVKEKKYTNEQLWPFFATRIPSLNQPYQIKKIEQANISKNDSVGLLKLFGTETITNPFRLVAY
ncbi:MAG: HipA N-terminal domain-containing protein [Prolixibacteraceae bacterium]|nr:HipA N-terminal domain-containing protein [Prolixibacteraceae bacterium]